METAIGETLDAKRADIDAWLKTNPPAGVNMPFDHSPGLGNLGAGFYRTPTGTVEAISHDLTHVTVILKSDGKGGYVIQTAFPHEKGGLDMSWQTTLRNLLGGYFGDQMFEEGVEEMVLVTESNPDYHQLYLSAIEEGIKAASQGKSESVEIMMNSYAWYVKAPKDAREFLERLRTEYRAHYEVATQYNPPASPI